MVKGVSRQVIVLRPPDQKLFEQAIFILKDRAPEVTDEQLLAQAGALVRGRGVAGSGFRRWLWALGGGAVASVFWLAYTIAALA